MKLCCEYIIGIKYKLRMMVILSERPYCIYMVIKSQFFVILLYQIKTLRICTRLLNITLCMKAWQGTGRGRRMRKKIITRQTC